MSRYWVLKTTDDGDIDPTTGEAREHWEDFQRERVIAIGWAPSPELQRKRNNLDDITRAEWIRDLFAYTYTDGTSEDRERRARNACPKILKFINEMSTGDGVFLCQGYAGNQGKDVHTYGFAKIKDRTSCDGHSTWWYIKRQAYVWEREDEVPVAILREVLGKGALRQVVHEISEISFYEVCRLLGFSYPDTTHE